MTNPILAKSEAFAARPAAGVAQSSPSPYGPAGQQYPAYTPWDPNTGQPYAQQPYAQPQQPYAQPQPPYPQTGYPQQYAQPTWQMPPAAPTTQKVMTLDDVLTKTGITMGTMIVVAVLSVWATQALGLTIPMLATAGVICGLAVIIVPFIAAARRRVGPGLAITFAVLEGVFLGAISLIFELAYPGIVLQAVLATFVAAALTLVAFRFGKFRLTTRMRKIVMMSMFAYVGVALLNLVLFFFGINIGLFPGPGDPVSIWAWLLAGLGVVLAVLSLVDDFQYVERGIANQAPASESWRAAYGLTVTMVWLYVNLLRILSYIRR